MRLPMLTETNWSKWGSAAALLLSLEANLTARGASLNAQVLTVMPELAFSTETCTTLSNQGCCCGWYIGKRMYA